VNSGLHRGARKMAAERVTRGRLIAVDGSSGPHLAAAARSLGRALRSGKAGGEVGLSPWDSSGIFTDLAAAEADIQGPSARTLTLLYAADLAFRLRWQIGPAIEAGHSVVAAPYVASAKALGIAAGLPRRWLDELFRFAPKPDVCYHVNPRGGRAARRATGGYPECFSNALVANGVVVDLPALRKRSVDYLNSLEGRGRCSRLTADAVAALRRTARRP
jgi:hypothetical protein